MSGVQSRRVILILCVCGIAIRLCLLFVTPYNTPAAPRTLSAYNDEPAHVSYTMHILKEGSLPRDAQPITSDWALEKPTFENYQSPAYYLIHATVCYLCGIHGETGVKYVGRILSLLCMVGITWIAFAIARHFGFQAADTLLLLVLLALSGVLVRFSVLSGNEAMAWLASGGVCLAFMRSKALQTRGSLYCLVFLFVFGVYVKVSLLILTPLVVLGISNSLERSRSVAIVAVILMLTFLTPLAVRNASVFGGMIPLSVGFGEPSWRLPNVDTLLYCARSSVFPWSEFWQNWKGLALMLPAIVLLSALLVVGLRNVRVFDWRGIVIGSALLSFVFLNLRYNQAEGRYLFIAWPAVVSLVPALPMWLRSRSIWLVAFTIPYLLFVI